MIRIKRYTTQILLILPVLFGALTVVSIIEVFTSYQTPLYTTRNTTLCTYTQTVTYDYVATLSSNTFYNKTTLRPGEGLLYSAIVELINITCNYEFTSSPQAMNAVTNPEITLEIESPDKWTRRFSEEEAIELLQFKGSLGFSMTLNHTMIGEFINVIEEEVGLRANTYNLNVKSEIQQTATIIGRYIHETITPQLTISFITGGDQGNIINIENLHQTKQGQITETFQIFNEQLESRRRDATAFTIISTICLVATTALYLQRRPKMPKEKSLEKIISPYRELITETTEKPPETPKTINISTLEDLAKTAEILARPILHTEEGPEHTFYIIDADTKYQHKTKVPTRTK